ncbi:uncharacterized protein LOC122008717 isoform X1 [Zingiber officinale]|uniref:Acid phosphatase/vanadium-dependent haloperoxidase-related protein n=1 Tax=Zingiber officinale TaxID=94328 RepID=A0A8J5FAE1_ZINOF|nr:uncharacterized protein LOC122008717 isoform X1 [Zingiber officinale]KAG6486269.1 hypothetical protein ZIOFF_054839 [Zingiber officinale]
MSFHWSSSASLLPSPLSSCFRPQKPPAFVPRRQTKMAAMPVAVVSSLPLGVDDLVDLARNKVLVAAAVAGTIGQLAKPLTSAIGGKGIDFRAAVRSGGMPSTHSSAVTAVATLLGLERGFSDSIFGMSVVFAALVMYDAQGVRREVGIHAKILNRIQKSHTEDDCGNNKLTSSAINSKEKLPVLSISDKEDAYGSSSDSYSFQRLATTSTESKISKVDTKEPIHTKHYSRSELNESVGHTEIQVIAGAILGLVVGLATELVL